MRTSLRLSLLLLALAAHAQHPRDGEIHDADTRAWWHTTEALAGDAMQGRDTGTAAYQRAADLVAQRFAAAGLQPAGDHGTFFQIVFMHQADITPEGTSFTVHRANAPDLPLVFLEEITTTPSRNTPPQLRGELAFRGYCGADAMQNVRGNVVICFGTQRQGLPTAAERFAAARAGHAAAILTVDDPYFTLEPPRWPFAYARSVTLATPVGEAAATIPSFRLSAAAFTKLLAGTGRDAAAILKAGGAKQPLSNFDLPGYSLEVHLHTTEKDISSPNVLAILPGADSALKDQYLAVSAHLDGYGFGTPVLGDNLYNGALDDAAYVALLLQLADDLRDGRQRAATEKAGINTANFDGTTLAPPRRSISSALSPARRKACLAPPTSSSTRPCRSRKWPRTSTSTSFARCFLCAYSPRSRCTTPRWARPPPKSPKGRESSCAKTANPNATSCAAPTSTRS